MFLITGGNGQLGIELKKMLDKLNILNLSLDINEMNIINYKEVIKKIIDLKPKVIFHCAAFTNVDKAEKNKDINFNVNVVGTKNIVEAAKIINSTLIYISTDYVFDGKKNYFYKTNDIPNPINEYGLSKFFGEIIVKQILKKFYIIRTSWLFGKYGKNFVFNILKLAEKNDKIKIVYDQIGRPTWTKSLAEFLLFIIKNKLKYGIYHFSNDGICSWYEFAKEILKDKKSIVLPIKTNEILNKFVAKRPKYSVMDLYKIKKNNFKLLHWKLALKFLLLDI